MDPLTAALNLATALVEVWAKIIDAMPPDAKAEFGRLAVEDMRRWQSLLAPLFPKQQS